MICSEVRRVRSRFLALELDEGEERAVRQHVMSCDSCRGWYASEEPGFAFAVALRRSATGRQSEAFVSEVMAGIRQRRSERRAATPSRRRWLAAAATVAATVSTALLLRTFDSPPGVPPLSDQVAATPVGAAAEPALVEVQGPDVRVYHFASAGEEPIRIAFVVDPQLEL